MKTILLLFITLSLSSQPINTLPKDYHLHVHGSIALQGAVTSGMYAVTERNILSNFLGFVTALGVGLAKEYIYDKAMNRGTFSPLDIEADVRGCLYGAMIQGIIINRYEKKNYIDTLKFVNLGYGKPDNRTSSR